MSIYEKLNTAMDNNDVNAYAELLHDDFKFVRHATNTCLLYTSPSPRDKRQSRMPSSA